MINNKTIGLIMIVIGLSLVTWGFTTPQTEQFAIANPTDLTFEVYDAETAGELAVYVNDQFVTDIPNAYTSANNNVWISVSYDLTLSSIEGINTLLFKNPLTTSQAETRIKNIVVTHMDVILVTEITEHRISGDANPWQPNTTWSTTYTIPSSPDEDGQFNWFQSSILFGMVMVVGGTVIYLREKRRVNT